MASLKRLINGQNLRFDSHQAGDGQPTNWKSVHFDKLPHRSKGKATFPLFGDGNPSYSGGMSRREFERIVGEVTSELKGNEQLAQQLAKTIADILKRFSSGEATFEHGIQAASKIAEIFDLDDAFVAAVEGEFPNNLTQLRTYHLGPDNTGVIELRQSSESVYLRRSRYLPKTIKKIKENAKT